MNTCTKCGQTIKEVVLINGLPYGTTCAENKLGIRQFPSWFKGGDWDEAKKQNDDLRLKNQIEFQNSRKITIESWSEWLSLSRLYHVSYRNGNNFMTDFTSSILSRLGYFGALGSEISKFETMEDAESNYKEYMGSFPYLERQPQSIDSLSPKQLNILNKYL